MKTEASVTRAVVKRTVVIELDGKEEIETFIHLLGCYKDRKACTMTANTEAMAAKLYETLRCGEWWIGL